MDNLFIRIALILLLGYVGFEVYREFKKPDKEAALELARREWVSPPDATGPPTDEELLKAWEAPVGGAKRRVQNGLILLTLSIVLAAGIGFVALKWVLPAIGDKVGETFYSSGEKMGPDRNSKALQLVTQGKYEDAIEEFRRLAAENPTDRFPVVEIVRLQHEKLDDVDGAIATLETAIQSEWAEDDAAFFLLKLADLNYTEKQNNAAAKELLNEVVQRFPGTRHAGMATHKLREIEEAEFIAQHGAGH